MVLIVADTLRADFVSTLPGQRSAGMRRSDPASLIDVAPTVLAALGLPAPARFRGIDLLADAEPAAERTLFAETLLQVPEQKSATRGDLTVLVESLPLRRSDAVAFDRSVDPDERGPRGRTPALDPQLRPDLEALGYAR